ncbi:GNAT family N-acetyltransferase [Hoeflea ulvae]|uniref:GNAT family N-acetyltransferase n=1 Tax=Hoeflea ulvae TaxID=2983764 RepID=A0ABT3YDU9_9HYPH|nr:GNAT family N-acetyltransferase [Hoeflea ulvae]MCY0094070.1 GNAT family N-acetyltransferase [Hoeflea ulvae]
MQESALKVRLATAADEMDVTAVLTASYTRLWQGHYAASDLEILLPLVTRAQPQLLSSGRFFVALADGELAGCGGWSLAAPGTSGRVTPGCGHVRHFAVHPDHLRKGVGRALYTACLSQARDQGCSRMEAWSSLQAVPFYERLGFRVIEHFTIDFPGDVGLASVRMIAAPA